MKKTDYVDFVKTKGFAQAGEFRLDSDKFIICILHDSHVQIFEKRTDYSEDFIIRRQPPILVDTYRLDDIELKEGKIEKKEVISGT